MASSVNVSLNSDVTFRIDFLRIGRAGFLSSPNNKCKIGNKKISLTFEGHDSQLINIDISFRNLEKFYTCTDLHVIIFTIRSEYLPKFLDKCKLCKHSLVASPDSPSYERCIVIRSASHLPSNSFGQILRGFGDPDKLECVVKQLVNSACIDLLKDCGAALVNSKWTLREPCPRPKCYPSCCYPPTNHTEPNSPDTDGPCSKRSRLSISQDSTAIPLPSHNEVIVVSETSPNCSKVSDNPKVDENKIRDFNYKPTFCKDGIKIRVKDMKRLTSRYAHMCDTVIDFYMVYITYEKLSPQDRARSHVFNCFFYTGLKNAVKESDVNPQIERQVMKWRHARVAKWTKHVDIFSKDFIIIPLNEDDHWVLAVICFPWMVGDINYRNLLGHAASSSSYSIYPLSTSKEAIYNCKRKKRIEETKKTFNIEPMPCILLFDSLIGTFSRSSNVKILRQYLQVEWDERQASENGALTFDKNTIRGFQPKVPQQPNLHDCGIFVMEFMESFFESPITSFTKQYFETMTSWFPPTKVFKKREFIRQLISQKYQESLITTTDDNP